MAEDQGTRWPSPPGEVPVTLASQSNVTMIFDALRSHREEMLTECAELRWRTAWLQGRAECLRQEAAGLRAQSRRLRHAA